MGERTDRQQDGIHLASTKEALHCCVSRELRAKPGGCTSSHSPRKKQEMPGDTNGQKEVEGGKTEGRRGGKAQVKQGTGANGGLSLKGIKWHRHPFSS